MQLELHEIDVFKTSVQTAELSLDLDSIVKDCYIIKKQKETVHLTNVNGYQSEITDADIQRYNLHGLKQVHSLLNSLADYFTDHFQLSNRKVVLNNWWININSKNSSNRVHTHPGAFLSGVIYVKNSSSSHIKLLNNNISEPHHWASHLLEDINKFPVLMNTFSWPPKDNSLLIFSGVQLHHVEANETEEDRISIAFNLNIEDINDSF